MIERFCKECGNPFIQFNGFQRLCFDCTLLHQKQNTRKQVRKTKLIGKGKKTEIWLEVDRPKWFRNHPPTHEGYYECYLGISPRCLVYMTKSQTTLDHVKARSSNPGKRRKQQNLKPACAFCNSLKSSIPLSRIKKLYPNSKVANS